MLMYKHAKLWEQAKRICKITKQAKTFIDIKDLRKFVNDNKYLIRQ